eukprot:scaffold30349_cov97-Skeletonema_marinoi.AAC.1
MAVVSNASSGHLRGYSLADTSKYSLSRVKGHLRRCSDADTSKYSLSRDKDASILSWPTIMGH